MDLLATFFVNKTRFLSTFFQIQILEGGYTRLLWEQNRGYSFFTQFEDISMKNQYFKKKLNCIRQSSTKPMTQIKNN